MVVHKRGDPVRSIAHRTHRLRLLYPPLVDFHQGGLLKLPRLAHTRKVCQLTCMHHLFSSLLHWLIDHPQRHRLDLFPLSSHHLDVAAIQAHQLHLWPRWAFRSLLLQRGRLLLLDTHLRRSRLLCHLAQRRFRHLHPREKGQLAAGGAKWHPGAQAHHALFQSWGERHFGSQP